MRNLSLCFGAAFAAFASTASFAATTDWRFCVATDFTHRVAYLTNLFESDASATAVGAVISDMLTKQRAAFQNVQCPLPHDRLTSQGRHAEAQFFLKGLGYRVVAVK